jgi:tRNA 2-thiouridine synthesizing protein E
MADDVLSKLKFDADGYMEDSSAWNEKVAEALATKEGIKLTDRHWVVIKYCRDTFAKTGDAPSLRNITKNTDVQTKELYELFPGGPGKLAAKVSGLKKPTGCI